MSDAFVFDKAKFHFESVQEQGLPQHQAFVHGGLFFGWAVMRGLTQGWLEDNTTAAFARFRRRDITGPQLFAQWDGALLDDLFTDEGLAFVCEYFPFQSGQYLDDYQRTLVLELPSEYHVPDTWDSFDALCAVLDKRHTAWRATWDPDSGRPDTRGKKPTSDDLTDMMRLPVLAVTRGVVLPAGTLGIRAGRPSSVRAVQAAEAGDGWLGLVPVQVAGQAVDPGAADLLDIGVVARLQTVTPVPDHPDKRDITVQLVTRFEIEGWADRDGLVAEARVWRNPEVDAALRPTIEEIRQTVAQLVKRRMHEGQAPGLLALAPALDGAALLDVVAREIPMAREEQLVCLEAPDLETRAAVVFDAVRRL